MNRRPASSFVHFFHPNLHLLCGYVGARVGWATKAEQVDCPACLEQLRSAAPSPRAMPPAPVPRPAAVPASLDR